MQPDPGSLIPDQTFIECLIPKLSTNTPKNVCKVGWIGEFISVTSMALLNQGVILIRVPLLFSVKLTCISGVRCYSNQ